jgi:hypothetical protein
MAEAGSATGGPPPFDPSQNVLNLVEAGLKRQDDLRQQSEAHAKEMRETARRYEDRLDVKDQLIRQAETARIDAIRLVDVGASERAIQVQAAQQAALASTLAATAEASRAQVAAAAAAQVTSLEAALEPLRKDVRELRDTQARGQGGREQVTETREVRSETRQGQGLSMNALAALVGVLGLALALYLGLHH